MTLFFRGHDSPFNQFFVTFCKFTVATCLKRFLYQVLLIYDPPLGARSHFYGVARRLVNLIYMLHFVNLN